MVESELWACRTKDGLRETIRSDLAMQGVDRWRARYRLTRGVVYFEWLLRRSEYWSHPSRSRGPTTTVMRVWLKVRLRRQSERLGFDVPLGVFGPGLSIAHSGLLVVSGLSSVGARCRMHQGVTLAGTPEGGPQLGDDVFIGANAQLIGPIVVADGAFIYPGAVCSIDVPHGCAAAGVPARLRPNTHQAWRPEGWVEADVDPGPAIDSAGG